MNLGQVYTKPSVAHYMVDLLTLPSGARVLDPCFGHGAFLDALAAKGIYTIDGIEIDAGSYAACLGRLSSVCHLYNADFLASDTDGKYDGVVMNPPYVRHEEIDLLANPYGISKETLRNRGGTELDAKANLYMYFTIRALRALKDGGQLVVIFPNSWERSRAGEPFRKAMSAMGCIEEHVTVCGNPFEGEPLVDVEILKIRCGGRPTATNHKVITIDGDSLTESRRDGTATVEFANCVRLSSLANVRRGRTTGCNRLFINPPVKTSVCDMLSSPKNVDGFSTSTARTDRYLMITNPDEPLTSEVETYLRQWAARIVKDKRPKSICNRINSSATWYLTPKTAAGDIIFPYIIRRSIRFIWNDRRLPTRDNFYSIRSSHPTALLMALLNNHYVWFQLEQCGKTYGNGVLKVQKYDVDNLMLVSPERISATDKSTLTELAGRLASTAATSLISRITDVLSKYYAIDGIKTMFENARNKRIGSHS